MRTTLYTVPTFYFEQPQGVPRLVPHLRRRGHDVDQVNLNYLVYREALSAAHLRRVLEERGAEPRLREFLAEYDSVDLIGRVDEANRVLDERFGTLPHRDFSRHLETLDRGLALLAAAYHPTVLSLRTGLSMARSPFSSTDISHALEDRRENPLIALYERLVLPRLKQRAPDVVGISMAHMNQFIPGFTLARLIKRHSRAVVVLGGPAASQLCAHFADAPGLHGLFASLIMGPGEEALHQLLRCLEQDGDLSDVANCMYVDRRSGDLRRSQRFANVPLQETMIPEYIEPRPRPIIAVEGATGCYWDRCVFCDRTLDHRHAGGLRERYHQKPLALLARELELLRDRHGPLLFRLTDAAVPPARLQAITHRMEGRWDGAGLLAYVRAEPEFASRRFCRRLARGGLKAVALGLESGCQQINDALDKGVSVRLTARVLKSFHREGIITVLFAMVGFPWEGTRQLRRTDAFLARNRRYIDAPLVSFFGLVRNTRMFRDPAGFGMEAVDAPPGDDLPFYHRFTLQAPRDPGVGKLAEQIKARHTPPKDLVLLELLRRRDARAR